jgi:phosphate transport system protein
LGHHPIFFKDGYVEHFFEELKALHYMLIEMNNLVADSISRSVQSIISRDREAAETVLQNEFKIDKLEIEIDAAAFKLLALQQPMAVDLRFILMVMKINNNLERMGDIAVNIARRALELQAMSDSSMQIDIFNLSQSAQEMIRNSMNAFILRDVELAKKVLKSDDAVDRLRDAMYSEIKAYIEEDSRRIHPGLEYLFIARGLERLADHATNIAEDVLFFVQGIEVRHHFEELPD